MRTYNGDSNKKYILFGAGEIGKNIAEFIGKDKVLCFCDNGQHTEGDRVIGLPIISADKLLDILQPSIEVIITTDKPKNIIEITKQLNDLNINYKYYEDISRDEISREADVYNGLNKRTSFNYYPDYRLDVVLDRNRDVSTNGSYFWQDLWAAKKIYMNRVQKHYDIGSRVDGFIAHLLTFNQAVTSIDIRPLETSIDGLDFVCADATNLLTIDDGNLESLSALCSLEHFGLGRYGDEIDPEACFKCFKAIQKKMKSGGLVYISVPIGKEHLEFNAHRVFYPQTIIEEFDQMDLVEFSSCYGNLYEEKIDIHKYDNWDKKGGERFGLFMFRKK